jgi:DNA repair exonuclease SbcCD ATPase subunit
MLGNNEKIQGVNIPDLFAQMVGELPWRTLSRYVNDNAQLLKICTLGGHRIDPNQRARIEKLVLNEAKKNDFAETVTQPLFGVWYPVHEQLHQQLEDYFHSDEYKTYRSEHKLTEEDYVLSDEKFDAFYDLKENKAWRLLLAFAPLKFTAEQAEKILNSQEGAAELQEKLTALEEQLAAATKKAADAVAEVERARAQAQASASEVQELKKQQRNLKGELDAANQKFTSASAETKRLAAKLAEVNEAAKKREQEISENSDRAVVRLQADLERIKTELNNWQNKYQEQLLANRQIVSDAKQVDSKAEIANADKQKAIDELRGYQKFVDLLLDRIDWRSLGSQLKLTNPTMKLGFGRIIKKINYDRDATGTLEETLPKFWGDFTARETELINKIANSSTLEVRQGDMEGFWNEVKDSFESVQGSLEARLFMLAFIRELLFSIYTPEQLQTPTIPKAK